MKNGVSCEDYEESVLSKSLKISRRIFALDKVNDLLVESSVAPQSSIPVANPTKSPMLMFLKDSLLDVQTRHQQIDL